MTSARSKATGEVEGKAVARPVIPGIILSMLCEDVMR